MPSKFEWASEVGLCREQAAIDKQPISATKRALI
jgi:hypothetical protein